MSVRSCRHLSFNMAACSRRRWAVWPTITGIEDGSLAKALIKATPQRFWLSSPTRILHRQCRQLAKEILLVPID